MVFRLVLFIIITLEQINCDDHHVRDGRLSRLFQSRRLITNVKDLSETDEELEGEESDERPKRVFRLKRPDERHTVVSNTQTYLIHPDGSHFRYRSSRHHFVEDPTAARFRPPEREEPETTTSPTTDYDQESDGVIPRSDVVQVQPQNYNRYTNDPRFRLQNDEPSHISSDQEESHPDDSTSSDDRSVIAQANVRQNNYHENTNQNVHNTHLQNTFRESNLRFSNVNSNPNVNPNQNVNSNSNANRHSHQDFRLQRPKQRQYVRPEVLLPVNVDIRHQFNNYKPNQRPPNQRPPNRYAI